MERDKLEILLNTIDADWIEDNTYDAYNIMYELIMDNLHLQDRIKFMLEGMDLADAIIKHQKKELRALKKKT